MDLTRWGGPKDGYIQDYSIQEVDLQTDKLKFFWSALEHIPLNDSYTPASSATGSGNVWDAYHFNSIGLTAESDPSDIIASSRSMWAIYKISRKTGKIAWQLGGKHSDFAIGKGAQFSWQHDARSFPDDIITMFDDQCCQGNDVPSGTPQSRGLVLQLDMARMTARSVASYYHDPATTVAAMGNLQTLENGNRLVGWGHNPYISEYKARGNTTNNTAKNLVCSATFPGDNLSYRAYRHVWEGKPCYPPSAAVKSDGSKITVYASWNGSTRTAHWRLFVGKDPKKLSPVATVRRAGFETAAELDSGTSGPYFQVQALDTRKAVIGESAVFKLDD